MSFGHLGGKSRPGHGSKSVLRLLWNLGVSSKVSYLPPPLHRRTYSDLQEGVGIYVCLCIVFGCLYVYLKGLYERTLLFITAWARRRWVWAAPTTAWVTLTGFEIKGIKFLISLYSGHVRRDGVLGDVPVTRWGRAPSADQLRAHVYWSRHWDCSQHMSLYDWHS